jgi:sigma-B regulation protein RsbU (phosphoserine phosphatase)
MLSLMGKLKITSAQSYLFPNETIESIPTKTDHSLKYTDHLISYFNSKQSCDIIEIDNDNSCFDELNSIIEKNYHYIIPLKNLEQNLAIILLGKKMPDIGVGLSDEEKYYARIVAQITSIALSNALNFQNIENQLREIEKRNLLFQNLLNVSNDFLSLRSEEMILKTFAFHLMGQLQLNRYAIFLKKSNNIFALIQNKFNFNFPKEYIQEISENNFDVFSLQIKEKYKFVNYAIPMFYQSDLKGFLLLGEKMSGAEYTAEDLLFSEMLSNTFIIALENHRLMQEEIKKLEIERDLYLAKEIQEQFLPKSFPDKQNWEFYGITKPSKMVGGDYFDFIELNERDIFVIVADVSGKGIGASLLMANLQAAIHSFSLLNMPIDELLRYINRLLYQNTAADKFITFFIGKLNCEDSSFSYINAGHNPPIFLSQNEFTELDKGCLPLGIQQEIPEIEIGAKYFKSGDTLAIFTDGIVEALNPQMQEFGKNQLIENLINTHNSSSKEIADNLLNNLSKFVKNEKSSTEAMLFEDDITLNIIKRK